MTTFTEPVRSSEVILSEAEGTLSREAITIILGAGVLTVGTVLGKITASGKYKAFTTGAADGSQTAAAILIEDVDTTAADVVAASLVRLAEVKTDLVTWDATVNAAGKTAGLASLASNYIIAR